MIEKLCYIDLETTGVDHKENGIIQVGGIIEIGGKIVKDFNFEVAPFPTDVITEGALRINKRSHAEIMTYPDPAQVHMELTTLLSRYIKKRDKLDKFFFLAYYADFDFNFLVEFFKKLNDPYLMSFFWAPILDVAKLAGLHLMKQRDTMENFKLVTVARKLGIDVDESKAHDAMYDIVLTRRIYKTIQNGGVCNE